MKKFISVLMTIMLLVTSFTSVLANPIAGGGNADVANNGNGGGGSAGSNIPDIGGNKLSGTGADTFVSGLLGTVQFVGYAIAIGMLIYVGIKYVMASANEKADLKNAMIKYVIGAILIAGASTIAGWFFTVGQGA